jgi:alkylation response protein AidB-like acyl-CoA dehydrogenase
VFESEDGFDGAFWDRLMELGAGAVMLDAEYGGLGLDLIDLALVAEVLGHEAAPGPFLGHVIAAHAIQLAGSAEQKAKWLPKLASGEIIGSVAFNEGDGRWAPEEWALKAEGDRLSGRKHNVLYPDLAGLIVVGLEGGRLAVVETAGGGVSSEALDVVDRTRRLWNVTFSDVRAEALDGSRGQAVFDAMLVLLAADAYGGAIRALHMTAEYAKTREQFGQAIARFQSMKHQIANMAAEVAPAQGLFWYAAVAYDTQPADRSRAAALAKSHVADRYTQATRSSVELHGGIGYTWEYDLQIWVKRAMFDYAYGGTSVAQRRRVSALDTA